MITKIQNSYTRVGILDLVSNASAAYSLRRLKASYTGALIKVRRSSDNVEVDIYADRWGNLDVNSLLSFVGANSGYITAWYDQSGNDKHLVQTSQSLQPRIVISGALQIVNGRPSAYYVGNYLAYAGGITPFAMYYVAKNTATLHKTVIGCDTTQAPTIGAFYAKLNDPTNKTLFALGYNGDNTVNVYGASNLTSLGQYCSYIHDAIKQVEYYQNKIGYTPATWVGTRNSCDGPFVVGGGYYADAVNDNIVGNISEVIVYEYDQSHSVEGIAVESSQCRYYGIA